jgi:hypothetical protein
MPSTRRGPRGRRQSLRQDTVQRGAISDALFELGGFSRQSLVGQRFHAIFEGIDARHFLTILLQQTVVAAAKYFLE